MILTALSLTALTLWVAVLLLPSRPWATRERLDAEEGIDGAVDLSDVTAVVPARNESLRIGPTLTALAAQGRDVEILVIDDESDDGTPSVVEGLKLPNVILLRGRPLPQGWSGKVWAQSQAEPLLERPLVLLMDADIGLSPGLLPALKSKLVQDNLSLVSVLAELPMKNTWERLLVPAFVYFFKLLYPFRLVNAEESRVAAAAGACVLMTSDALRDIGGFSALKDALIDDCTLARLVKSRGHRIWLGLTRSARSKRRYTRLADIWNMVARTAYTQLKYSLVLLWMCTLVMLVAFFVPLAALFSGDAMDVSLSLLALTAMALSFAPTLSFYGINPMTGATLPLAGLLYLAMTWSSALRFWAGERSQWHGRVYRA